MSSYLRSSSNRVQHCHQARDLRKCKGGNARVMQSHPARAQKRAACLCRCAKEWALIAVQLKSVFIILQTNAISAMRF